MSTTAQERVEHYSSRKELSTTAQEEVEKKITNDQVRKIKRN
jgi:hypothetical protein